MALEADTAEKLKDPVRSAHKVGLRYVTDAAHGIRRLRRENGFQYRRPDGKTVRDPQTLNRIRSLAIPPAWTEVWIGTSPDGHLQATGRDDRRRKQFRYHPRWREIRDETKYARLIAFARTLPRIRRRVKRDLALAGIPRQKVLATIVRLLEVSFIRVGNLEYARDNGSIGLTTMRDRHVDVRGSTLRFRFRGKSGKWHEVDIRDRRLARIVKQCQDLPGQELFQFLDDQAQRHDIRSEDVNEYLREISGKDFTAKDFRTWSGTVLALRALRRLKPFETMAEAKKNITSAIQSVAAELGNTPAVCRKCYIHPHVLDAYLDGALIRPTAKHRARRTSGPDSEEADVVRLLQQRVTLATKLSRSIRKETIERSHARRTKVSRSQFARQK